MVLLYTSENQFLEQLWAKDKWGAKCSHTVNLTYKCFTKIETTVKVKLDKLISRKKHESYLKLHSRLVLKTPFSAVEHSFKNINNTQYFILQEELSSLVLRSIFCHSLQSSTQCRRGRNSPMSQSRESKVSKVDDSSSSCFSFTVQSVHSISYSSVFIVTSLLFF